MATKKKPPSDLVKLRREIKASEQRSHAQIVKLVQRSDDLGGAVSDLQDGFASQAGFNNKTLEQFGKLFDRYNGLGGFVDKHVEEAEAFGAGVTKRLEALESKSTQTPDDLADILIHRIKNDAPPAGYEWVSSTIRNVRPGSPLTIHSYRRIPRLTRLYRAAVAWFKRRARKAWLWITTPYFWREATWKAEAQADYNAEHPMTKGDDSSTKAAKELIAAATAVRSWMASLDPGALGHDPHYHRLNAALNPWDKKATEQPPKKPCTAAICNGGEYDPNCSACRAANGETGEGGK